MPGRRGEGEAGGGLLDDDPLRGPVRFQSAVLEQIPVYRKLFRDAFPAEAALSPGCVPESAPVAGACDNLINNLTVVRATATFMRTVVTRNTPWDRFLAGENGALTPAQRRGARLFFTRAPSGGELDVSSARAKARKSSTR